MYVVTGNDDVFALNAKTGEYPVGALVGHRPADHHRLLRLAQPRAGDGRGHGVPGPARRQCRGARHQDRQGGVEDADRGLEERLRRDQRAALLRRHHLQRHHRRRIRRTRPADRARGEDRQDPVAVLHAAGTRRGGRRDLASGHHPRDAGRSKHLEHARARSGTRAVVFRHRQLRARLRRRDARGRQPVLRLDHGDRCQDRTVQVALPAGAPRHLGL